MLEVEQYDYIRTAHRVQWVPNSTMTNVSASPHLIPE